MAFQCVNKTVSVSVYFIVTCKSFFPFLFVNKVKGKFLLASKLLCIGHNSCSPS